MADKTEYTAWQAKRNDVGEAIGWNNLPKGPRYQGDNFSIEWSHSSIKLTRCGQQSHAGKNYWESPDALNKALIAVIIKRSGELIPEAIELLKKQEQAALFACKEWVDGMQARIAEIEEATEVPEETAVAS